MRKIFRFVRNIILIVLLLGIVGGILFHNQILDYVKDKASQKVAKALIESNFTSKSDSATSEVASQAKDIYDQMDEKDQQKVEDIIKKNLTQSNLNEAKDYIVNGDTQGLEEFAQSKLSEQDQKTVKDLYNKYKDKLQ